jgi:hypothetical protein
MLKATSTSFKNFLRGRLLLLYEPPNHQNQAPDHSLSLCQVRINRRKNLPANRRFPGRLLRLPGLHAGLAAGVRRMEIQSMRKLTREILEDTAKLGITAAVQNTHGSHLAISWETNGKRLTYYTSGTSANWRVR